MKKVLIGVGAGLVLIVAGALIAPSFIDWNQYRDDISAWVRERTGRQLEIAGGLSLSVLPTPTLTASDVTFANDPAGTADHMVRMEELAVRVALGPLLGGRVQVESVRLVRPQVVLEMLPDGRGNWTFPETASDGTAGGPVPPAPGDETEAPPPSPVGEDDDLAVALDSVTIEDGSIVWRNAEGAETRVEAIDGDIAADSLQGPFNGDLAMTLRGSRITAGLRTGRFGAGQDSTPLTVTLGVPDAGGEVQVQGRLSLGEGEGAPAFDGTMTAQSPSLARTLAAVQGVPPQAPLDRPFSLTSQVSAGADRVALDAVRLTLGETEGTGAASVALGEPPRVDVALAFTRIDLDALLREARAEPTFDTAAAAPPATISPTQAAAAEAPPPAVPQTAPAPAAGRPLVPALPADLAGSIDITADLITWRGGLVRQAVVSAGLAGGEVTLNEVSALLPGSSEVKAFGFLDTRAEPAGVNGSLDLKSSNLRELLAWLGVDVDSVPADRLRRFALTAAVQGSVADLTVPAFDGVVDTTRFQGAVALRPMQERPAFGLSLSADTVNLDAYLPRQSPATAPQPQPQPEEPKAAQPQPETAPAEPGQSSGTTPARPAAPPPVLAGLEALNTFDANIKARVGTLIYRGEQVQGARVDVALAQGTARFGDTVVESIAGAKVGLSGALSGFGGTPRFDDLAVTLATDSPEPLARLAGVDLPPAVLKSAPWALSATLNGDLARLGLKTTNQVAGGSVTGEGTITDSLGTPAVDMAVAANHASLVGLVRRLGTAYEPQGGRDMGPVALTGRLAGGADTMTLSGMTLRAGPTTFSGEVSAAIGGEVPAVTARLAADRLPIDRFLPAERQAAVEEWLGGIIPASFSAAPAAPRAPDAPVVAAQAGAQRWSREPLDLSGLDALRLDLALTAQELSYDRWRLSQADLTARLADGVLEVPALTGTLFGGPVKASARVARGADGAAAVRLDTTLDQMDIGAALESMQGERAARGRMDFRAALQASGNSQYALLSSLTGNGGLSLSKVDMRRVDKTGGSALAALLAPLRALDRLAGVVGGESYGVDVRGEFTVAQGVLTFAEAAPLTIQSNLYNGSLHGAAALPAWTVDAQGEVRLAQNALTALLGSQVKLPEVVPVALSGPLDQPNVKIGTGRQTGSGSEPVKPEKALRDMLKQALPEELQGLQGQRQEPAEEGGEEQEQPKPKPEKVLRDTLKNLLFQ